MVKDWKDLDKQTKYKLSYQMNVIDSRGINITDAMKFNEQEWHAAGLSKTILSPPKRKGMRSSLEGQKSLLNQIDKYRFNETVQYTIYQYYINKGITSQLVIDDFIKRIRGHFNKDKAIVINTIYHKLISNTKYTTTDKKTYKKLLFEFSQPPQTKDFFFWGAALRNNWFTQIRDMIITDIDILYKDLLPLWNLNKPKYLGVSLVFETYDSKSEHYVHDNTAGFHTRLLIGLDLIKFDVLLKMTNLDKYFNALGDSLDYYIYISDIHFNLQL